MVVGLNNQSNNIDPKQLLMALLQGAANSNGSGDDNGMAEKLVSALQSGSADGASNMAGEMGDGAVGGMDTTM